MTPKRVLMIAYHFPPVQGSSGVHRTLNFARYLPLSGWQPIILTVSPGAYERVSDDQLDEYDSDLIINRALAFDTARHLAFFGKYPRFLALPDRWLSWVVFGTLGGLRLIRKYRPDVIWSTYPIATAHLIGDVLARRSNIPWVADFRDSMTEETFPTDPRKRRVYQRIERKTIYQSTRVVFTAPSALQMYADRYPDIDRSNFAVIQNGYDDRKFAEVESINFSSESKRLPNRPLTLIHSGLLYPSERDPICFLEAVRQLMYFGKISSANLRIILRASGYEDYYRDLIAEYGLKDVVSLAPSIPYSQALQEMMTADGLLLFQASNCNHQIPAKLYEYLRTRKPILAFTDPKGDTAQVLRQAGVDTIARLDRVDEIFRMLEAFIQDPNVKHAAEDFIAACSRRRRATELAKLLDGLASSR